jgi:hypothetical protein
VVVLIRGAIVLRAMVVVDLMRIVKRVFITAVDLVQQLINHVLVKNLAKKARVRGLIDRERVKIGVRVLSLVPNLAKSLQKAD